MRKAERDAEYKQKVLAGLTPLQTPTTTAEEANMSSRYATPTQIVQSKIWLVSVTSHIWRMGRLAAGLLLMIVSSSGDSYDCRKNQLAHEEALTRQGGSSEPTPPPVNTIITTGDPQPSHYTSCAHRTDGCGWNMETIGLVP